MNHTEIQDLVMSVVNTLPPMRLTQIAQTLQNYHVYPTLFRGSNGNIKTRSGTEIVERVLLNADGNARNISLYEPDLVSSQDGLAETKTSWAHTTTSYLFEDHEISMCSDKHELLELIKVRREQCLLGLAELLEKNYFGKPSGPEDTVTPRGLFYWIVKSAATTSATENCGFFGGNPEGFSDVAGLNHESWRNYVAPYYSITGSSASEAGDFIGKLRRAWHYTNWRSPLGGAEMGKAYDHRFRLFCNYETMQQIEEHLEAKNDELVRDVAPLADKVVFRGTPFFPVTYLDKDTTNPVYGVDSSTFTTYFLKGFHNRESTIKDAPNQHSVSVVFIDNSYNFVCSNRRQNFVMHKVATKA